MRRIGGGAAGCGFQRGRGSADYRVQGKAGDEAGKESRAKSQADMAWMGSQPGEAVRLLD